jgi:hypothetical protein
MAEYALGATDKYVIRTEDGATIPNDPANKDWVEYQKWLADDGVPDPYVKPPKVTISTVEWAGRWTNAEYRTATAAAWQQVGPNAKNWAVVVLEDTINLSNQKTATLKASLIADGILTAERAAIVFSAPE